MKIEFDGSPLKEYENYQYHLVGDSTGWYIPLRWVIGPSQNYWIVGNNYYPPEKMNEMKWTHYYGPVYNQDDVTRILIEHSVDERMIVL